MEPLKDLEDVSALLIEKAKEGNTEELAVAVEKATDVRRLSFEREKMELEIRTLKLQEDKLQYELKTVEAREKEDRRKSAISAYAPLVTSLVLMGGLIFQTYQYVDSDKQKQKTAEETKWQEAVKNISQASRISTASITLRPFLASEVYGDRARTLAIQLMSSSTDTSFFDDMFNAIYSPVNAKNIEDVRKLDQTLWGTKGPLDRKSYDPVRNINDVEHTLNDAEKLQYNYVNLGLAVISKQVGALLTARNGESPLDLSSFTFFNADFQRASFQNVDISHSNFIAIDLKDANLFHVGKFSPDATFDSTAWWDAKSMDSDLLEYLMKKYPCNPAYGYGPHSTKYTVDQYNVAVARLKSSRP